MKIWTDFHENEAKKKFFEEKKNQNGQFFKIANYEIFSRKFHRPVLELVGFIDKKPINVAQLMWL